MEVTGVALNLSPRDAGALKRGDVGVLHNLNHYVFYDQEGQIYGQDVKGDFSWYDFKSWDAIRSKRLEKEAVRSLLGFLHLLAWRSPFTFYHFESLKGRKLKQVRKRGKNLPGQLPRYLVVSDQFANKNYNGIQIAGVRVFPQDKHIEVFAFVEQDLSQDQETSFSQLSFSQLSQSSQESELAEEELSIRHYLKWFDYSRILLQTEQKRQPQLFADSIVHFFYHMFRGLNMVLDEEFITEDNRAHLSDAVLEEYKVWDFIEASPKRSPKRSLKRSLKGSKVRLPRSRSVSPSPSKRSRSRSRSSPRSTKSRSPSLMSWSQDSSFASCSSPEY